MHESYGIGICQIARVCQPATEMVVRASASYVINHEGAGSSSVITPRHGTAMQEGTVTSRLA